LAASLFIFLLGRPFSLETSVAKRKLGKRTPSGQLSRAVKQPAQAGIAPAVFGRVRDALAADLIDPIWGTQLGQMHLRNEIDTVQFDAAKRWFNVLNDYFQKSSTSQPGIGNGEADPNSEPGRKGQPTAYDRGLRVLSKDSLSEKAVRRLFRGEYLDFAERLHAANGLNVLAHHYKFTNAR